jgi:hypothetical protein
MDMNDSSDGRSAYTFFEVLEAPSSVAGPKFVF